MKPRLKYSSLKFRTRRSLFFTVCIGLAGAATSAQAQKVLSATSLVPNANYNAGGTWDDGAVPNGGDDVVFDRSTGSATTQVSIATAGLQSCNTMTFGSSVGTPLGAFNFRGGSTGSANRRIRVNSGVITMDPSVTGTITLGRTPSGDSSADRSAEILSNLDGSAGITLQNNNTTQTLYSQIRIAAGVDFTLNSVGGPVVVDTDAPGWPSNATVNFASLNGGNSFTSFTNSYGGATSTRLTQTIILNGTGAHSFGGLINDGASAFNALEIDGIGLQQTLTGANNYSGGTTITNGALIAGSGSALGTGDVNLGLDGLLIYEAGAAEPLTIAGDLNIAGGGFGSVGTTIGTSLAESRIDVTGDATITSGDGYIDIYAKEGVVHATGVVTLLQGAGAGTDLSSALLGFVFNNTDFTVAGFTANLTNVQATITAAAALGNAYWNGDLANKTWAISEGVNSNWASSDTGTGTGQGLIPGSGANVVISTASPADTPIGTVLGANMSILSLTISDTSNGLGLDADGFALTLGAGGLSMNASVPDSSIGADVALGVSQIWTNNSTNSLTVSGAIAEASAGLSLTKAGTGPLVLTGASTYSGTTTISGGVLQIGDGTDGNDGTINNSLNIVNNANLTYNRFAANTHGANITGTGSVTKSGDGTQTLTGTNNYSGPTAVESGSLVFGKIASLYNGNPASWTPAKISVQSGAALGVNVGGVGEFDTAAIATLLGNLGTSSSVSNGMNAGSSIGFDTSNAGGNFLISGALSDTTGGSGGSRGISKIGAGMLTLSGTNNYTGTTTVNAGTLKFAKTASLYGGTDTSWTPANINVKGGATLALNVGGAGEFGNSDVTTLLTNLAASPSEVEGMNLGSSIGFDTTNAGGSFTIADFVDDTTDISGGARGLVKEGAGALILTAANFYSGPTTISGGTLQLGDGTDGNDGSIAFSPNIVNNGILIYNRFGDFDYGGQISGTGSLTKTGGGTQTLSAINTYTGFTTVTGGTLLAGSGSQRGTAAVNVSPGAVYEIGGTNLFTNGHGVALEPSRVITADAATLYMDANADTRFGSITLTNGSTWTSDRGLGGFDALLGNTTAGAAIISVTGSGAANMNGAGGIHIQGVQNFAVEDTTGDPAVDLTVSMILGNQGTNGGDAGGILKTGAGTMELAAVNAYAGTTTVDAGAINVSGSISSAVTANSTGSVDVTGTVNGAVTVNSGGTLSGDGNVVGNTLVGSGGHLAIDIAATSGTQTPLNITGLLTMLGGNVLDLTAAAPPADGVYILATTTLGAAYVPGTVNLTGVDGTVKVSGTNLVLQVGTGTAYDIWADSEGLTEGNNGATDDPEFDGIENSLEFVLGGDPLISDTNILPVLSDDGTYFVFTFNRSDDSLADIGLTFEYGSNLSGWTPIAIPETATGIPVDITDNGATDTVVVKILKTSEVDGKLFGRLKAVK